MTIVKLEALQPSSCTTLCRISVLRKIILRFSTFALFTNYFNFTYYGISYQISNQNPMTPDR